MNYKNIKQEYVRVLITTFFNEIYWNLYYKVGELMGKKTRMKKFNWYAIKYKVQNDPINLEKGKKTKNKQFNINTQLV